MKKIIKAITLCLVCFTMMCLLSACSFFETPSKDPVMEDEMEMTIKEEMNATGSSQSAMSDAIWNQVAMDYAQLEENYQILWNVYVSDVADMDPDIDIFLQQADELIKVMGSTKRSQISEADVLELQELIAAMNETADEIYENIVQGEELEETEENEVPLEETEEVEETGSEENGENISEETEQSEDNEQASENEQTSNFFSIR